MHIEYCNIPKAEREQLKKELEDNTIDNWSNENEYNNKKNYTNWQSRIKKKYLIQELVKKNQNVLVQVIRDERGGKGVLLTTYISLVGKYLILMPNTTGITGISRKISDVSLRQKILSMLKTLEIPNGASVIVRTAASNDITQKQLQKDYERGFGES